jgi:hypothetical protein
MLHLILLVQHVELHTITPNMVVHSILLAKSESNGGSEHLVYNTITAHHLVMSRILLRARTDRTYRHFHCFNCLFKA